MIFNRNREVKLWAVVFWLVVWQIVSLIINSDLVIISPVTVLAHLFSCIFTVEFWQAIFGSSVRIIGGFSLGVASGIVLVILSVKSTFIKELIMPLMITIKTIPVASFIVLILMWFSSRNLSVIISFLMVLPIVYINILNGVIRVDSKLLEMAKLFRIPLLRKVMYIYIPQVIPYFRSGCSVALGLCWKAGIAAELIGMPQGTIGEKLQQAKVYLDTPELFSWTLVIVILSITFEKLFLTILKFISIRLERV